MCAPFLQAILEFNHSRKAVGYIRERNGDNKFALFAPTDARVPRILIPRYEWWLRWLSSFHVIFCPLQEQFAQRVLGSSTRLCQHSVCRHDHHMGKAQVCLGWETHDKGSVLKEFESNLAKMISGRLLKRVGDDSDIDNCTEGILMNNDIDDSEFSPSVTSSLPTLPFVIPKSEVERRRDFRSQCVFTIDPLTAR